MSDELTRHDEPAGRSSRVPANRGPAPTNDTLYRVLSDRRAVYDQMMWQVPVLSLTAQAFLFSIALGSSATRAARVISASLALVSSVLSVQLMAKHRHHEYVDAQRLEAMETDLKMMPLHAHRRGPGSSGRRAIWGWFVGMSSYRVWLAGLGLFGIAAIAVLVLTIVDTGLL